VQRKILTVELLGTGEKLKWNQTADGLRIAKPNVTPSAIGHTFKVTLA